MDSDVIVFIFHEVQSKILSPASRIAFKDHVSDPDRKPRAINNASRIASTAAQASCNCCSISSEVPSVPLLAALAKLVQVGGNA